jgi:hypothetical protein
MEAIWKNLAENPPPVRGKTKKEMLEEYHARLEEERLEMEENDRKEREEKERKKKEREEKERKRKEMFALQREQQRKQEQRNLKVGDRVRLTAFANCCGDNTYICRGRIEEDLWNTIHPIGFVHPMDFKVKWDTLPKHLEVPYDKVKRESLLLSDTPLSEDEKFCLR